MHLHFISCLQQNWSFGKLDVVAEIWPINDSGRPSSIIKWCQNKKYSRLTPKNTKYTAMSNVYGHLIWLRRIFEALSWSDRVSAWSFKQFINTYLRSRICALLSLFPQLACLRSNAHCLSSCLPGHLNQIENTIPSSLPLYHQKHWRNGLNIQYIQYLHCCHNR